MRVGHAAAERTQHANVILRANQIKIENASRAGIAKKANTCLSSAPPIKTKNAKCVNLETTATKSMLLRVLHVTFVETTSTCGLHAPLKTTATAPRALFANLVDTKTRHAVPSAHRDKTENASIANLVNITATAVQWRAWTVKFVAPMSMKLPRAL